MSNIFSSVFGGTPKLAGVYSGPEPVGIAFGEDQAAQQRLYHSAVNQAPSYVPDDLMMLKVRMLGRTLEGAGKFQDLHICRLKEKVLVFAVVRDKYVVAEDDAQMFPSDNLVNSLRLLL